jgi:hypothetical protein
MWTGFIWLRIGAVAGSCEHRELLHKMSVQLASEGFCCMELV